jgi:ATP-binding cassette subfamily B protein
LEDPADVAFRAEDTVMKSTHHGKGFAAELRLLLRRARQVWRLVPRRHKWALGGAVLVMVLTSACNTAMPLLLGGLVDEIKQGSEQRVAAAELYPIALAFLGAIALAYLLREALGVFRRYLVENGCTRISRDMTVRLVSHLMKTDLAVLSVEKVGTLHGRISRSTEGFVRLLRLSFLDFFPAVLTGLFALVTAVVKQPVLGVVMVGVIPVSLFLTIRQLISQKGVRLKLLRTYEEIDGAVVEQLSGLEYVRAANTQAHEIKRMAHVLEKRRAKEIRHHFQMSLFGAAKALNEGFFHVLLLGAATYYAITGVISFGDVLTFSVLFLSIMTPMAEIHRILDEGHECSLRVGDLLEMLSTPIDRSFTLESWQEPRLVPQRPVIEVQELHVEYQTPGGKCKRGLDGISLAIRYGETVGVAGSSGCGKSTWLKVLLRLVHPQSGKVLLGGVPLESVSRGDITKLMGYVGQSPFIFAGTVGENIAYGSDNATMDDIVRAAQLANLHDEIQLMPGKYDAVVTERGQNLSGGQRQRIAIARILLKQPPILILDEATSALDNLSERHVQRSLGLTNADRTTIVVAHRLTTLRDADRILVFDQGRIVEVGGYDELVGRGGVFTALVRSAEQGVAAEPGPQLLAS